MVIYAGTILDTTLVWVGVIVLSLLAMVMYFAVVELEKWMTEHLAIYRKARGGHQPLCCDTLTPYSVCHSQLSGMTRRQYSTLSMQC